MKGRFTRTPSKHTVRENADCKEGKCIMMQDEKIIELYFKRDEGALVETSDKYGNYCRSIAWIILNDEETAKECFNDTLYHSWQAIPPKRPNCLKTFLGKITRNVSIKRLEKVYAQKRGGGEAILALDELEECVPNAGTTEEERIVENMVIRDVLNAFLASLPKQNRRIFMRRYGYCSSIGEIATAFDLSEVNVRTTLFRIRGRLKQDLEKAGVVL